MAVSKRAVFELRPLQIRRAYCQWMLEVCGRLVRRAIWADKAEWLVARPRKVAADVSLGSTSKLWALVKTTSGRRPCGRRPAVPSRGLDGWTLQSPARSLLSGSSAFNGTLGTAGCCFQP